MNQKKTNPLLLRRQRESAVMGREIVAYKGIVSLFNPAEIMYYECINKEINRRSLNSYHFGSFSEDFLNVDCIDREYQLANPGWCGVTKPKKPGIQGVEWTWIKEDEEPLFLSWHQKHFEKKTEMSMKKEKAKSVREDTHDKTL